MKLAAQPGTVAVEFYPFAYGTPQRLANIDQRFQLFLTYLILRRVFFDNLLTHPIQTIKEHLIPPLVTQRGLKSQPSKLCLGKSVFHHSKLHS